MRHLIMSFFIAFSAMSAYGTEARLTWLGHAAFQLKTAGGKTILIDPWINNPKATKGLGLLNNPLFCCRLTLGLGF